jgi:hypothetical protein
MQEPSGPWLPLAAVRWTDNEQEEKGTGPRRGSDERNEGGARGSRSREEAEDGRDQSSWMRDRGLGFYRLGNKRRCTGVLGILGRDLASLVCERRAVPSEKVFQCNQMCVGAKRAFVNDMWSYFREVTLPSSIQEKPLDDSVIIAKSSKGRVETANPEGKGKFF